MQLVIPPSRQRRSLGVHLSGIIRCIAQESGILKPEWAEELSLVDTRLITDPVAITRICMGLAWEEWYIESQLPEVIDHPGEMLLDGIYMTHDGEELITLIVDGRSRHVSKLHEIKLTYKSMRTIGVADEAYDSTESPVGPLSNQWMWMAQTKGYCKAAMTRFVDLHVLFVCGDYSYPLQPKAWRYSIEFTQEEIDQNWALMTDYHQTFLQDKA